MTSFQDLPPTPAPPYQGLAVPKVYYQEVRGALFNQTAYLDEHPEELNGLQPPSTALRSELTTQLHATAEIPLREVYFNEDTSVHEDETHALMRGADEYVAVTGDDPLHIAAGFHRIARSLAVTAQGLNRDPLHQLVAQTQAACTQRLADAIIAYHLISDEHRQRLPSTLHLERRGIAQI